MVLIWVIRHVYFRGHSMLVNRHISLGLGDPSKGWLYRCDCGEFKAR
jgi:hypothetical protein